MTIRDRITAALHRQPVDQVPMSIYAGMIPREEWERSLRAKGLGLCGRAFLFTQRTPNCQTETQQFAAEGVIYSRTVIRTPVGEVSSVSRPGTGLVTSWRVEHFIKGPDDYRTAEFIVRDSVYQPAYDFYLRVG